MTVLKEPKTLPITPLPHQPQWALNPRPRESGSRSIDTMDPDVVDDSLTLSAIATTLGVCGTWLGATAFVWSFGGCAKKKKNPKPLESDFEKPPPLQMPPGGTGTQSVVSQVPESDKTKPTSSVKKAEASAVSKPEASGVSKPSSGAEKKSEAKKVESKKPEAAPKSEKKKEESVAKKSEKPQSDNKKPESQASKKSEAGKSDAKTDKKEDEKDDQYQQVDFGPGDPPPPPPP